MQLFYKPKLNNFPAIYSSQSIFSKVADRFLQPLFSLKVHIIVEHLPWIVSSEYTLKRTVDSGIDILTINKIATDLGYSAN